MQVVVTRAGLVRGLRLAAPLTVGLVPFGLVVGVLAQAQGLSAAEQALMSALVFAGAAQILALELWTDPAPIASAALAAAAVNLRFALMGPHLAAWFDALKGWRRWLAVGSIVDHAWALAIAEMRAGRHDVGVYLGAVAALWLAWLATTALGHAVGGLVSLPRGHPLFFAAPACFVALLVPLWRGRREALPWAVAAAAALALSPLLPQPALAVVCGAVAGSLVGAWIETSGGRSA